MLFDDRRPDDEIPELRKLRAQAPPGLLPRLRRRVQVAQVSVDLIERQAWSFWIVIDSFLRLFFSDRSKRRPGPSGS